MEEVRKGVPGQICVMTSNAPLRLVGAVSAKAFVGRARQPRREFLGSGQRAGGRQAV